MLIFELIALPLIYEVGMLTVNFRKFAVSQHDDVTACGSIIRCQ